MVVGRGNSFAQTWEWYGNKDNSNVTQAKEGASSVSTLGDSYKTTYNGKECVPVKMESKTTLTFNLSVESDVTVGVVLQDDKQYDIDPPITIMGEDYYNPVKYRTVDDSPTGLSPETHSYRMVTYKNVPAGDGWYIKMVGSVQPGVFYIGVKKASENSGGGEEQIDGDWSIPFDGYPLGLWETYETNGMKVYLGGWKYQRSSALARHYKSRTTGYYQEQGSTLQQDSWDDAKTNYSPGAEDPYFYKSWTSNETSRSIPVKSPPGDNANNTYLQYSYAQDNARNEYIEKGYTGRYEMEGEKSSGKVKGNPFTVPCFGDFIKLEPETNGKVKLYVMQNGAIEYDVRDVRKHLEGDKYQETIKDENGQETTVYLYQGGLTSKICWRPVYIVDEAGTRLGEDDVTASTNTEISIGRGDETAYVYDFDHHFAVLCRKEKKIGDNQYEYANYKEGTGRDGNTVKYYYADGDKDGDYYKHDPNGWYVTVTAYDAAGKEDHGEILKSWNNDRYEFRGYKAERMTYKDCFEALQFGTTEDKAHYDFYTNKFNIDGTDYEVWPEKVNTAAGITSDFVERVWGPKYTGDGWIVVSKGYVLYEFDVQAGKSYYVFSNDTKLGFCGYEFQETNAPSQDKVVLDETETKDIPSGAYESVTLTRTFQPGWNAICLPFSVTESKMREWFGTDTNNDGIKEETYELVTYNGTENRSGKLTAHFFHHVYQDIIAGYPYMIWIPKEAKAVSTNGTPTEITFNNVTIEPKAEPLRPFKSSHDYIPKGVERLWKISEREDYIYEGFYNPTYITAGSYYVTAGGYETSDGETFKGGLQLYTGKGDNKMKGFRAFLKPNAAGEAKDMMRISGTNFTNILDEMGADWNDATVINDLMEEMGFFNEKQNVYSITGQMVRQNTTSLVGLPKGIYIVNGKKYFVK